MGQSYIHTLLWIHGLWSDYLRHCSFFGVFGVELVVGSTLGSGVVFAGYFVSLFLCGVVLSVSTLGYPPVFTLGVLYVLALACECSFCLGVGSLSLLFPRPFFGFAWGAGGQVVWLWLGLTVTNVLLRYLAYYFSSSYLSLSHTASFPYFQKKYWPAAARLHISHHQFLRSVLPVKVFPKTFLFWQLVMWWRLILVWRVFWLIVEKIFCVYWSLCPFILDVYLAQVIAIQERSNFKPGYSMKFPWPVLS